jgi:hypothetical protein
VNEQRKTQLLSLILLVLLSGCQQLHEPKSRQAATATTAPVYVRDDAVDVAALIPPPPNRGSDQERADLETVLHMQSTRTEPQVARARGEEDLTVFAFADLIGPQFNAQNCPRTAMLFAQLRTDSRVFSNRAKNLFQRPRPPVADSRVQIAARHPETDPGYPSGHATRGMLMAEILATIFPDKREALLDRGRQIGFDRVILGVHYPSDVFAGQVLGHALTPKFLTSERFQADLAEAGKEMHQPMSTGPRS